MSLRNKAGELLVLYISGKMKEMKNLFLSVLFFPGLTFAQSGPPPVLLPKSGDKTLLPGSGAAEGKGIEFVRDEFAPKLTSGYLQIVLAVGIFMLVVAGVMYLVSDGNDEMVGKAKTTVLWTILGVIAAILSYVLVSFVANLDFNA